MRSVSLRYACALATVALGLGMQLQSAQGKDFGQILSLGDSITAGSGSTGGYRDPLYTSLSGNGDSFTFVGSQVETTDSKLINAGQAHHEGHGGYRINDIDGNLTALHTGTPYDSTLNGGHWLDGISSGDNARPAIYPNIVLLLAGTNDISNGVSVNWYTNDNLKTRMRSLLNDLFAARPDAQVFVGTVTKRTLDHAAQVVEFNAFLPTLLAEPQYAGRKLYLVDLYTAVGDNISDGVHPNTVGYAAIGGAWYSAIQQHASPVPEPTSFCLLAVGGAMLLSRHRKV